MKMCVEDFKRFAASNCGVNPLAINRYENTINNALISPNIIEERSLNVATMDVFSRLMVDRIIFLGTEITSDVANIITAQLLYLQAEGGNKEINMFINSPGGSVYDGLAIYDTMQYISCPVYTTCVGLAASMASIILSAGEQGNRSILPHSRVLIHQPLGGVSAGSQASDIEIVNKEIQTVKTELFTILSKHSRLEFEQVVSLGDRDCWLRAQEALDYGLVDKIIAPKK